MRADLRLVNGAVRLDLMARSEHERTLLTEFAAKINGTRVTDVCAQTLLDAALRVESVGFAADGSIESVAIEGPEPK